MCVGRRCRGDSPTLARRHKGKERHDRALIAQRINRPRLAGKAAWPANCAVSTDPLIAQICSSFRRRCRPSQRARGAAWRSSFCSHRKTTQREKDKAMKTTAPRIAARAVAALIAAAGVTFSIGGTLFLMSMPSIEYAAASGIAAQSAPVVVVASGD